MHDDWRLRIDLGDNERAGALTEELRAHTLEHDIERSLHDRVMVSVDVGEVFCYTDTQPQAEAAARVIDRLARDHGWEVEIELRHWHPSSEEWVDPAIPLPEGDAARAAERDERLARERADSAAQGYPEFEVRIQCASRGEAGELAGRLRDEGIPVVHRWHAVLIGADDEESAEQLASRLRAEAPEGAEITVEGNLRTIYETGPWHPFAILGGLGG